ncbi:MAG: hypothetical protein KU37_00020 [Sulfuricurvum sp. PC08-66]|nr:MAG: hypothetical protein KU37_00020 [Sulfuricurvum sp. PC08-66]
MKISALAGWSIGFMLYLAGLLYFASSLSISPYETSLYFGEWPSLLYYPMQWSTALFGRNDIALRLPMIVLHFASLFLLYRIAKLYFTKPIDIAWTMGIFVLIPSINITTVLIHYAGLITFLVMLFVYLYHRHERIAWGLMPIYIAIDASFFVLSFGVGLLALLQKRYGLVGWSWSLTALAWWIGDIYTVGEMHTMTLQTMGLYMVLLSPILFFYFLYVVLFRIPTRGSKDILWAISVSALFWSLLLSLRQGIKIELYEPYVVVALPLLVRQFMNTYRMRIRPHRVRLKLLFWTAMTLLMLNSMAIFFNKIAFAFLENPQSHIFYQHYFIRELSDALKAQGIDAVHADDWLLQKRLSFYGIGHSSTLTLKYGRLNKAYKIVSISYMSRPIMEYSVTK